MMSYKYNTYVWLSPIIHYALLDCLWLIINFKFQYNVHYYRWRHIFAKADLVAKSSKRQSISSFWSHLTADSESALNSPRHDTFHLQSAKPRTEHRAQARIFHHLSINKRPARKASSSIFSRLNGKPQNARYPLNSTKCQVSEARVIFNCTVGKQIRYVIVALSIPICLYFIEFPKMVIVDLGKLNSFSFTFIDGNKQRSMLI